MKFHNQHFRLRIGNHRAFHFATAPPLSKASNRSDTPACTGASLAQTPAHARLPTPERPELAAAGVERGANTVNNISIAYTAPTPSGPNSLKQENVETFARIHSQCAPPSSPHSCHRLRWNTCRAQRCQHICQNVPVLRCWRVCCTSAASGSCSSTTCSVPTGH